LRSGNDDVQSHIGESRTIISGFRLRAKWRALKCAIAHRGMTARKGRNDEGWIASALARLAMTRKDFAQPTAVTACESGGSSTPRFVYVIAEVSGIRVVRFRGRRQLRL